jgi:hypothetical protein
MQAEKVPKTVEELKEQYGARVLPEYWLVLLDETEFYDADFLKRNKIKRIGNVYLFDKNLVTHICSFSGSYYLEYVEFSVEYEDGVTDEEAEEADSELYGIVVDPVAGYWSERDIDRILESAGDRRARKFFSVEEEFREGFWDLEDVADHMEESLSERYMFTIERVVESGEAYQLWFE